MRRLTRVAGTGRFHTHEKLKKEMYRFSLHFTERPFVFLITPPRTAWAHSPPYGLQWIVALSNAKVPFVFSLVLRIEFMIRGQLSFLSSLYELLWDTINLYNVFKRLSSVSCFFPKYYIYSQFMNQIICQLTHTVIPSEAESRNLWDNHSTHSQIPGLLFASGFARDDNVCWFL